MLQLAWYWRRHVKRNLIRTLPLAALALFNLTLFGVAGVFSSQVTKAPGNETLTRSGNCGILDLPMNSSDDANSTLLSAERNASLSAEAYQKACYDNPESSLQCGHFIQGRLPWISNENVPCPFPPDMCLLGDNTAYQMVSGLIDSHEQLGINAPRENRVQLRAATTCAIIPTKGFTATKIELNNSSKTFGDVFLDFLYGSYSHVNYTYRYNTHSSVEDYGYELT